MATERDIDEVLEIQTAYQLASDHILLMPLGMRPEEQQTLMPAVIAWCRRPGFRFSPRLHILVWGPRRGV